MTTTLDPDTKLCIWHDPQRRDEARRRQVAGGKATAAKSKRGGRPGSETRVVELADTPGAAPETLEDATRWASWAVVAVATGKIDRATGREVGGLLRAFMDGRKNLDRVDERVKALQAKLKQLKDAAEGGKR